MFVITTDKSSQPSCGTPQLFGKSTTGNLRLLSECSEGEPAIAFVGGGRTTLTLQQFVGSQMWKRSKRFDKKIILLNRITTAKRFYYAATTPTTEFVPLRTKPKTKTPSPGGSFSWRAL